MYSSALAWIPLPLCLCIIGRFLSLSPSSQPRSRSQVWFSVSRRLRQVPVRCLVGGARALARAARPHFLLRGRENGAVFYTPRSRRSIFFFRKIKSLGKWENCFIDNLHTTWFFITQFTTAFLPTYLLPHRKTATSSEPTGPNRKDHPSRAEISRFAHGPAGQRPFFFRAAREIMAA